MLQGISSEWVSQVLESGSRVEILTCSVYQTLAQPPLAGWAISKLIPPVFVQPWCRSISDGC